MEKGDKKHEHSSDSDVDTSEVNDDVQQPRKKTSKDKSKFNRKTRKKHKTTPKSFKKKDPIGDRLSNASDLPSEYHSDHTTEYDSPEETVIVTQDGQLGIAHFSLVKKSRCKKSIKCPVCRQDFNSTHLHNKHMRDKHSTFHYACSKDGCGKEFNTRNTAYKHVQKHYLLRFGSSMCDKRCDNSRITLKLTWEKARFLVPGQNARRCLHVIRTCSNICKHIQTRSFSVKFVIQQKQTRNTCSQPTVIWDNIKRFPWGWL